ncbi:MAG: hypothetical protein RIM99_08765 [Cyclobacteriaceae bacterium]
MKKINLKSYLLVLVSFFLVLSCGDPLEDEINAINETVSISKDITYTLVDDDYEIADDACGCAGFGSFSSEDDVKENIPIILDEVFPGLGDGSSASVTYDFFNGSSPDLRGTYTQVTVPDGDYDLLNGFDGFDNFGNADEDVVEWVNWKGYEGEDGDYIDVTFAIFAAGNFTPDSVSRIVYTVAYGWMWAEPLPDDSYADFFGESPPDFSFEDEGEDNIPFWLKVNKVFAVEGDRALIQWNWDNGPGTSQSVALFIYSGGQWIEYGDIAQVTQETLNFGHDGTKWVADNTIKYTLGVDDWADIAAATLNSNPDGSASISSFGNFDLTLWTTDQIFDAITEQLPSIFPSPEAGQKYLISYAVWRPGSGTDTINIIWDGTAYSIISE